MVVSDPGEFHRSYADAFNSGDIEAVVTLYEPEAVFVPQPNTELSGQAAISDALKRFQAAGQMNASTRYCVTVGDVALASASWQITGTDPEGVLVDIRGISADLLRRQPDGRWLLVVDHPFTAVHDRREPDVFDHPTM
jgi:uncharacterized protein (TIGR02246 family)